MFVIEPRGDELGLEDLAKSKGPLKPQLLGVGRFWRLIQASAAMFLRAALV
jgi:hypothetical protein